MPTLRNGLSMETKAKQLNFVFIDLKLLAFINHRSFWSVNCDGHSA